MVIFPALFGNERLKESAGRDFADRRHSHAYIFEGKDGSGKMTAALNCAAALACENRGDVVPCGECVACRKVFGGFSPDVEIISRPNDRKTIGVDSVRAVRENLWITPNDGDHRVYIIDDADKMTPEAQNALLISLEEPPPFVVFILLAENSEALLETVRSRATTIRMERLSFERTLEFLRRNEATAAFVSKYPEKAAHIAASADGSAGKALEAAIEASGKKKSCAKADAFDARAAAERLCEALILSDRAAALDITRSIPKGSENSRAVFSLCQAALRDVMAAKSKAPVERSFFEDEQKLAFLSRCATMKRLSKLFAAFDEYIWLLTQSTNEVIVTTLAAME